MTRAIFNCRILFLVTLALAVAACSGPQTKKFAEFANSGVRFAYQTPNVYDYAFAQEVNADSAKLIEDRRLAIKQRVSGDPLADTLKKRDNIFRQRLDFFNLMKKHALLLRSYFTELSKLASGEQVEQAGNSASNVATQLGGLTPGINNIRVRGMPISSLFKPIAELGVGAIQNKVLKEHLELHGATVWNAIGLQREMFAELRMIELDQDNIAWRRRQKVELSEPIRDLEKTLPTNWPQRRLVLLTVSPSETPISAAIEAAEGLQQNLKSLSLDQGGTLDQLERSVMWTDALLAAFEKARRGGNE